MERQTIALNLHIDRALLGKALDSMSVALDKIDENACIEVVSDIKRPKLDKAIAEFERGEFIVCKDFEDYKKKVRE